MAILGKNLLTSGCVFTTNWFIATTAFVDKIQLNQIWLFTGFSKIIVKSVNFSITYKNVTNFNTFLTAMAQPLH
jgi:hypothetical protein